MMDLEQSFNIGEMFLWLIIGVLLFVNGFCRNNRYKKLCFFLSAVFVLFGFSDSVEAETGVWWQPWRLLLWKAACVTIFIACLIYYLRNEYRRKMPNYSKETH
jgi:hypothetical protein